MSEFESVIRRLEDLDHRITPSRGAVIAAVLPHAPLGDGSLHYRVSRRGHHHHLVCVSCGNVQDLDECVVGDLVRELAASTEYEIEGHWLEFYGRCATCRSPVAVAAGP